MNSAAAAAAYDDAADVLSLRLLMLLKLLMLMRTLSLEMQNVLHLGSVPKSTQNHLTAFFTHGGLTDCLKLRRDNQKKNVTLFFENIHVKAFWKDWVRKIVQWRNVGKTSWVLHIISQFVALLWLGTDILPRKMKTKTWGRKNAKTTNGGSCKF